MTKVPPTQFFNCNCMIEFYNSRHPKSAPESIITVVTSPARQSRKSSQWEMGTNASLQQEVLDLLLDTTLQLFGPSGTVNSLSQPPILTV